MYMKTLMVFIFFVIIFWIIKCFDFFLSRVLKEANRLKVNIDDLLFYDKEKIKQDVYEIKKPIFFCYDVIELR